MIRVLAEALVPVHQQYLHQARQMQALSFAVHIPLVAFGISFPAMVLFAESRWLRTGDALYRTLARRWTRIMVALFAVGVITGTILSFEMGLLWPNFTATFGGVFGLGFAIEGFSFFLEAIFIGIYVYGWGRLSPRAHFLSGIPIVLTGFTGSLMVISVNAWMNHPGGFTLHDGKVVDVHQWQALFANTYLWHELVHMYIAGYIVSGFVLAGAYALGRLRGRWGRYERTTRRPCGHARLRRRPCRPAERQHVVVAVPSGRVVRLLDGGQPTLSPNRGQLAYLRPRGKRRAARRGHSHRAERNPSLATPWDCRRLRLVARRPRHRVQLRQLRLPG
jgi:hypothetical protein